MKKYYVGSWHVQDEENNITFPRVLLIESFVTGTGDICERNTERIQKDHKGFKVVMTHFIELNEDKFRSMAELLEDITTSYID